MKVYVVTACDYDDFNVNSVHASEEAAKERVLLHRQGDPRGIYTYDVVTMELED